MFAYSEDRLGQSVLTRILAGVGIDTAPWLFNVKSGNGRMRTNVAKYVKLAKLHDVILFTDLDSAPCPAGLILDWLGSTARPERLHIRVAVREVESWVLADREGVADFLNVPRSIVPRRPDEEADPKRTLLLVAEKSRTRAVREDIVVRRQGQPRQAPNYNLALAPFVADRWDFERAVAASPSLARTVKRFALSLGVRP